MGRARGHFGRFLQHHEAVPELRGYRDAPRRADRTPGCCSQRPSSRGDARTVDSYRQLPFILRPLAGCRQFRAGLAHGISPEEFSVRARIPTPSSTPTRRCSSISRWLTASSTSPSAIADHHAVYAGRCDGARDHRRALTLAHAEALAGLTLAQIVRPNFSAVAYWSFTSNVDMKLRVAGFLVPPST